MLNYQKKPSKIGAEQIAHAQAVLEQAQADGLLEKPKMEFDNKQPGSVEELKYWGGLLRRLGEEGSEDARKLMSDVEAMVEQGEDITVITNRFVGGLMRYAVLQAYERPAPPGKAENFSIRMPTALLEKIDSAVAMGGAGSRSEFIRTTLEIAFFAGRGEGGIRSAAFMTKILALVIEHPEEMLLFYLIRAFFDRPDVASVANMMRSLAGPLSEIIAAVGGGDGVERVEEAVREVFETADTSDSESEESEDAVDNVE